MSDPFLRAQELFQKEFHLQATTKIFSPGRLEILGNHTDHNHGHCLVAGCSLGIHGACASTAGRVVISSEGYGSLSFSVNDLAYKEEEKGTSIALAKGVLFALKEKGYKIGGFKAAINSDIFPGAGVSSSAAYELFVAECENVFYNDGRIPLIEKAKAGQIAENKYFGKASGLLDQCGSSFGGVQYLDFKDPANVGVESLPYPTWLPQIVLVNPGASHSKLSDLYSQMPNDMWLVAKEVFQTKYLADVDSQKALEVLSRPLKGIPERARLRALHFFGEDKRVQAAREAFLRKDLRGFLSLEKETEHSQETLLQNVMVPGHYEGSPLEAVNRANLFLKKGAARVMGGGLVGSIIAFVPAEELTVFLNGMEGYYGKDRVVPVTIPSVGARVVE